MDRELRELRQGYRNEQRRMVPDPGPDDPPGNPNWCGRDECPSCQGYDEGPPGSPDCPWLGEEIDE